MPFINPDDAQQAAPKAAFVNPDDHLPPDDLDHQSTSAVLKKQLESINAVGETAANTAVGFGGLVGGIVGAGPSVARQHISKALGITDKEPETLEQAFKGISSAITQPLYDETSSKGQDYTDWFNENVANRILTPMMGLHLGIGNIRKPNIRNPFRKLREDVNTKLDTLDQAPPTEPPAPPPARPFVNPDEAQGDLFGGYGFNEQQAAESRAQDTHPGQPDLFGPLNVPPADMPPTTPWQRRAEPTQQGELPLQNSPQQIADMQNRGSGQPDMFSGIQENGAQPANIPGPSIQAQVQLRRLFDEHAARLAEQEAAAHRAGDAQAVIDARQAAMELEVKRQQMLDSGAAERARQERAPVAGLEEARAREQQASVDKTQPYMDERNQGLIDDTDHGYVANQFGGGQDGMRMDHAHDNLFGSDPMPIRADRSMEAQNLQDPLQRNLWGDELPRQSAQEAPRGITAAIDKMAPADRAAAIKDQFHIPNSQRGAINMDALVPGYKKERMINGGIKLTFKGGFDPKVMAHDRSGKQIAELKLNTDTYMPEPSSNMEAGHVHVDPAYRRQGIAEQMYKYVAELGNDVQASSTLLPDGRRMWEGFEKKGVADGEWRIPARQRGAIDLGKVNDSLEKVGEAKVDPYTSKERVVMNATGINHIPRGEAPESIVAQSLAEGKDGPSLFTHLQSGLQNAGEKGSALMRGVARWLSYGEKVGDYNYANKVRPLERMLNKLPTEDLVAGQTILRREMFRGAEYTPEQLKSAGLSERAIAAHQAMRQAYKDVLENTNASLRALGKKEIKADNAYMASMWNGNWHVPIKDTSGKLAWYLKVETKGEANRAINWLKNHPELSKTLDLSTAEPKYHPQNVGSRVPRDVMGAYQDMLQFFDGDVAEHMKSAMEAYTKEQGFKFQQHQQHFKNKSDIRGFQGDRPWLSEKENAMAQAKAQVQYLKEAYHWAPMQEALSNIKQVLSHPELNKMQPNNMNMAKLYTEQAMGLSRNLAKGFEQAIQKVTSSIVPSWAGGGNLGRFVAGMKNMTYLQQLGLSTGYMIATPLQAFLLAPSWHLKLSGEGFGHSALGTSIRALYDFSSGLLGHELHTIGGKQVDMPMTAIGKKAFAYMEANGIISQNIFHENSGLGDNRLVHGLKQTVGLTISIPEKVARAATFMSFVHHLHASGKLSDTAIFQRAEELTNHTLTDFRRMSRPLIVDRLGQAGEMAYVYKSPLFNQYNNLAIFARDALKGKPGPLLAALGMSALMGGATEFPLVNEMDKAWELLKTAVSNTWPEAYHHVAGLGVKGTIISKMNELSASDKVQAALGPKGAKLAGDTGAYGLPSAATGTQLASRFSSKIGDVSNPLGDVAPVLQEMKEWSGIGHAAANPNSTSIASGLWQNAPPLIKGQLETHGLPGVEHNPFKTVKTNQGQGYTSPNQLGRQETTYIRTPQEERMREAGLTSLQEATTKSSRYINNQESARFHTAQEASMDKMFDAAQRKDKPDVLKYARAYFDNHGDGDSFTKDLDKKLDGYMFTPEQRAVIKAQSIAAIQNVIRMRKLQGH